MPRVSARFRTPKQATNRLDSVHLDSGEALPFALLGLLQNIRRSVATDPAVHVGPLSPVFSRQFGSILVRSSTYTLPPRSSHTGTPRVLPLISHKAMSSLSKISFSSHAPLLLLTLTKRSSEPHHHGRSGAYTRTGKCPQCSKNPSLYTLISTHFKQQE